VKPSSAPDDNLIHQAMALTAEVNSRKGDRGLVTRENWLADYGALILRRNNPDPVVCVPWSVWVWLLTRVRR